MEEFSHINVYVQNVTLKKIYINCITSTNTYLMFP